MEEERSERQSKIDRDLLQNILISIGDGKLPKKSSKPCVEKKMTKKMDPYLTLGRSVKAEVIEKLEDLWQTAYQDVERQNKRRKGRFRSLHTYRSRLDAFKLERLFVPDDVKLPGRSITEDIDPEYYTIVGGRPIKDACTLSEHKWAVNTTLLTRLATSRVSAIIDDMQLQEMTEMAELLEAEKELDRESALFEKFLEEDYQTSAQLLAEAEAAARQTSIIRTERKSLEKEVESVKSRVTALEEQWQLCKLHQQFLYSVSPPQWRRLHDVVHHKDVTPPPDTSLFKRIRGSLKDDVMSSKMSRFLESGDACETQALYFTEPSQLTQVLSDLEERNRSSLVQCEKLQPAVLTITKAKELADAEFEREHAALTEDVNELREEVETLEARGKQLEEEVKMTCQKHLQPLLTNRKTISLTASLEHAYERVIGVSGDSSKLDILEMMRAIENKYETLRVELDLMPADLVARVMASWKKENQRTIKQAKLAADKVHQMDMLSNRFLNALKPNLRQATRRPMSRSEPPREKKVKAKPPPALTQQQLEHRYLFGETSDADKKTDDIYRPMLC